MPSERNGTAAGNGPGANAAAIDAGRARLPRVLATTDTARATAFQRLMLIDLVPSDPRAISREASFTSLRMGDFLTLGLGDLIAGVRNIQGPRPFQTMLDMALMVSYAVSLGGVEIR